VSGKKVPARRVPAPALTPEARQFVEGATTSERSGAQPLKTPGPRTGEPRAASTRSMVERADGRLLRRHQIYFDAEIAKRLRRHCADVDSEVSAFVNEAVEKELSRLGV
jgi:hypothetical protein